MSSSIDFQKVLSISNSKYQTNSHIIRRAKFFGQCLYNPASCSSIERRNHWNDIDAYIIPTTTLSNRYWQPSWNWNTKSILLFVSHFPNKNKIIFVFEKRFKCFKPPTDIRREKRVLPHIPTFFKLPNIYRRIYLFIYNVNLLYSATLLSLLSSLSFFFHFDEGLDDKIPQAPAQPKRNNENKTKKKLIIIITYRKPVFQLCSVP